MTDINLWLSDYAESHNFKLITDTNYGLNVDRDEPADRETEDDKDAIFLNIVESGYIDTDTSSRFISLNRTIEVGLFKRCIKETDGISYYNDIQYLLEEIVKLYSKLLGDFEVTGQASYDTGVDALDSNNVVVKLTFTIVDEWVNC